MPAGAVGSLRAFASCDCNHGRKESSSVPCWANVTPVRTSCPGDYATVHPNTESKLCLILIVCMGTVEAAHSCNEPIQPLMLDTVCRGSCYGESVNNSPVSCFVLR